MLSSNWRYQETLFIQCALCYRHKPFQQNSEAPLTHEEVANRNIAKSIYNKMIEIQRQYKSLLQITEISNEIKYINQEGNTPKVLLLSCSEVLCLLILEL